MGLLDTILGRTKPVRANLDALFALPAAAVTLEASEGAVPSGHAGVCWRPPAGRSPADVQAEIEQLLEVADRDDAAAALPGASGTAAAAPTPTTGGTPTTTPTGSDLTQAEDSYGFRWLLLANPSLEDLVTRVHLVNSTLTDNGWGPQLLCSVFGMTPNPEPGSSNRPFFLVYLYKRGTFYPFAPIAKERRDAEFELHIRSVLGVDLPVESDLSRWFPLWDLPVT